MKRERNSFRERFFPKSFRAPTEYQILNWEYEGGSQQSAVDNIVIINGVLCETTWDRWKATMLPITKFFRRTFGIHGKKTNVFRNV